MSILNHAELELLATMRAMAPDYTEAEFSRIALRAEARDYARDDGTNGLALERAALMFARFQLERLAARTLDAGQSGKDCAAALAILDDMVRSTDRKKR